MAKVDCFNENNLCYNIKNVQIILKNLATFSNPYSLSISFSFLVLKPQLNSLKQNNEETKNT